MKTRRTFVYHNDGLGGVSIFGFCVSWKDIRRHPLLFSERHGFTKQITVFGWSLSAFRLQNINAQKKQRHPAVMLLIDLLSIVLMVAIFTVIECGLLLGYVPGITTP